MSTPWDDSSEAEDSPLLPIGQRASSPIVTTHPSYRHPRRPWQAQSQRAIVGLIVLVKFCLVSSGMLMLVPAYRLIEDAMCHAHYGDASDGLMDEMRCKVRPVQSRLAFTMGWITLLQSIISETRPCL
jgi:hypothetical protein